jgi:predicted MFS family arabinose efflux permease
MTQRAAEHLRRVPFLLALCQFVCSFAGSNMNVMITDIIEDLHTTVQDVQIAITIFLLVMAALMIPGGKVDRQVRAQTALHHRTNRYGVGALMSAMPGLGS